MVFRIWLALSVLLCALLDSEIAEAGSIPSNRLSVLLLKFIPYNEAWDDRKDLHVFVLACGESGKLADAEEFAELLEDTDRRIRETEKDRPMLQVRAGTVRELDLEILDQATPDIIFVMSHRRDDGPLIERLAALEKDAARRKFLVLTDSRVAFESAGSLLLDLGPNDIPEIHGNRERIQAQGAKLKGPIIPLIIWETRPR